MKKSYKKVYEKKLEQKQYLTNYFKKPYIARCMKHSITLFHTDLDKDPFQHIIIQDIKTIIESKNISLNSIDVSTLSIKPCQGCFHCWTKTPGSCILKDDGNKVAHEYINSDTIIFLSRITFGGYQSELKYAIDRLIPLILPFFRQYHGETHHKKRYQTYPNLISIGLLKEHDEKKEQLFSQLLKRNTLNFCPDHTALCIITEQEQNIKEKLTKAIEQGTGGI